MPVSLNRNVSQVANAQPIKQPETKSETKSSIGTGAKVAIGTALAALAATGIYIATKGKSGKNIKNMGKQIESLTHDCKCVSKRFNFETPQIAERLEEISKLSQKEKLTALKKLHKTLDHAEWVKWHIELGYKLPKGMKALPEDVRQAYEQKDVLKTGELFKQHLDKLPNARPAVTKGATVAESIENTFGKGINIKPHTYDLSKESPVIHVYRNAGGYKDGLVGKEGRYYSSNIVEFPDKTDVLISAYRGFKNGKSYGSMSELGSLGDRTLENSDRKLVRFTLDSPHDIDTLGKPIPYVITVLSPNNKYTPLQKDLITLIENPEKIDTSVFDKLTTVIETRKDYGENLYKYLDYDVLLSAIQSMAK